MTAAPKRSGLMWGTASDAITAAGWMVERVCLERGPYAHPRIYAITCYEVGLVFGLLAFASAIVATKRGSRWWLYLVLVSGWFSLTSCLSEI